jgi:hypothetical protein
MPHLSTISFNNMVKFIARNLSFLDQTVQEIRGANAKGKRKHRFIIKMRFKQYETGRTYAFLNFTNEPSKVPYVLKRYRYTITGFVNVSGWVYSLILQRVYKQTDDISLIDVEEDKILGDMVYSMNAEDALVEEGEEDNGFTDDE